MIIVLLACTDPVDSGAKAPASVTVVTFNTGTSEGLPHDAAPDDGYTSADAVTSDTWYGDGLAWVPAIEAAQAFLADVAPSIVTFQEIFYSEECASIPEEAQAGFICERWETGDPTVASVLLGDGWQVACHPGKPDKCAAVRADFGTFANCDDDFCLEGMTGSEVEGCGSGARVAKVEIVQSNGQSLNLINVHGSSGVEAAEQDCRAQQFQQVFEDLVDPNGSNLIMGDFNTDPGRLAGIDPSADVLIAATGDRFAFLTEVGADATPTYQGLFNIDHVIADTLQGSCGAAGMGELPVVTDAVYFDHLPIVCTVSEP